MATGGELLKRFRIRGNLTIVELPHLLPGIFSADEYARWEANPNASPDRQSILALIGLFRRRLSIVKVEEANELLRAYNLEELTISEMENARLVAKRRDLFNGPSLLQTKVVSLQSTNIFISYSRNDWTAFVEPLVSRLNQENIISWVDQHLLEGGQDWLDEINKALEECDKLILCVSPDALASRWVKMEYRYFLDENKPIIPIICRETKLPAELRRLQFLKYGDMDKLIKLLK